MKLFVHPLFGVNEIISFSINLGRDNLKEEKKKKKGQTDNKPT